MTQEQANWEWMDARVKKLEELVRHQADYIKHLEEGLESSLNLNKAQAERQGK